MKKGANQLPVGSSPMILPAALVWQERAESIAQHQHHQQLLQSSEVWPYTAQQHRVSIIRACCTVSQHQMDGIGRRLLENGDDRQAKPRKRHFRSQLSIPLPLQHLTITFFIDLKFNFSFNLTTEKSTSWQTNLETCFFRVISILINYIFFTYKE